MCDSSSPRRRADAAELSKPLCDAPARSGSRRRRLWELPARAHCPVIGVCLPITALRKLVRKALRGEVMADDYDLHIGAVAECGGRNALSELLQKQLDQRYAATVLRFSEAKTPEALWERWVDAVERGDVAGAFWAGLTHPRCDEALECGLIRDMHMIQHQAGASVRADLRRMETLQAEHAATTEELRRQQERNTRHMSEKAAEIAQLTAELAFWRAEAVGKDGAIARLHDELDALRINLPDLKDRMRQQLRLSELSQRLLDAENHADELAGLLAQATERLRERDARLESLEAASVQPNAAPIAELPATLQDRTVLCVGGRTGNVTAYRQVIERKGGQFAFHDGGIEDSQTLLEASLGAADMVICQTGCISHNAYWRVKDFCKRHGKRCVFVDNPSASSLARSLEDVFAMNTARES